MNKPLSQLESRIVSDWLRREKHAPISNSFMFWRKRPTEIVEIARKELGVRVTDNEIRKAIGREDN